MSKEVPEKIDRYILIKSLGKGGMGEVFLAHDPLCKREVALKQMRPELSHHRIIKERFLREAQVAAQLVHPCIIPIFSIDPSPEKNYYTMPYVEGETLKSILKQSYEEEKEGEVRHPIGSSIPALLRIFLSICEAMAYTHSKKIVHRDLKPDNIIVGKYGEVLLLDWGLADFIGAVDTASEEPEDYGGYKNLTRPGKVPGTLNYMAPERINAEPSTPAADIYSLGVILYQLLTLRTPFRRPSVKDFRKSMHLETLIDPAQMAPYRDISQHLADIVKRCLEPLPQNRYANIDALIEELKHFLEGKPKWIAATTLNLREANDWKFQENILLTKHMAITRSLEVMRWVGLMISEARFSGNIKLQTEIKIGPSSKGVGLLLGVPDASQSTAFDGGYCIWLQKQCHLFLDNVEVMVVEDIDTDDGHFHQVCIEKMDNHLIVFIDNKKICHHISNTPLAGTHIGIVYQDEDFEMTPLQVLLGSQNAMVGCLAIPDAFLANKNYSKAFLEYEKIAHCFFGRTEGRQALFHMGMTLVEQAICAKKKKEKEALCAKSLEIFSLLRQTPAAPLEYLGKSLVYKATGEIEEEIKCLELALRKYPKHPLLKQLREQIVFRLHEASARNRIAAYHFALLCLRHLPVLFESPDHARLLLNLKKYLDPISFFASEESFEYLACYLAFLLRKPIVLSEMIQTSTSALIKINAMHALLGWGECREVEERLSLLEDSQDKRLIRICLLYFQKSSKNAFEALCLEADSPGRTRSALLLFERSLLDKKGREALPYFTHFPSSIELDALHIQACLEQDQIQESKKILDKYPLNLLMDEYSPIFIPMGCYLAKTESKTTAIHHLLSAIDLPNPPISMLLSHELRAIQKKRLKSTTRELVAWELVTLLRQLRLFYHCVHSRKEERRFSLQLQKKLKKC